MEIRSELGGGFVFSRACDVTDDIMESIFLFVCFRVQEKEALVSLRWRWELMKCVFRVDVNWSYMCNERNNERRNSRNNTDNGHITISNDSNY